MHFLSIFGNIQCIVGVRRTTTIHALTQSMIQPHANLTKTDIPKQDEF